MIGDKIRLLVVDDEERFVRTLAQRLSMRDFDVTAVTSGQEALQRARSQQFDLALVDLKMPKMTGEEVLRVLKQEHPFIEVVILTGHGSVDSAVHCTKSGSHAYLQKPCETEELLVVLKDAYQKRIQRKLALDQARVQKLARIALGDSPLGILRRLKELERTMGSGEDNGNG